MQRDGALPRSRRYMAVPFVGKDTPTASSEFAHPDVAIGISILAYRYEGLRKPDFGALIQNLRHMLEAEIGPELKRPTSLLWMEWIEAAGRRVRGTKTLQRREAAKSGAGGEGSARGRATPRLHLGSASAVGAAAEELSGTESPSRQRASGYEPETPRSAAVGIIRDPMPPPPPPPQASEGDARKLVGTAVSQALTHVFRQRP